MGRCLGQLHQTLSAYSPEKVRNQLLTVDQPAIFSKMDRIEAAISEKAYLEDFDQQILAMLRQRRNWLMTAHPVDLKLFSSLQCQALHGDFQETNLFFADSKVSAIIDWDQAYVAPRTWEIMRTLDYVLNLDVPRCQIFLKAYRKVFPVLYEEMDVTAQAYGWVQTHNLWVYSSFYLDNNHRVRNLLHLNFTPLAEKWAEIAGFLQ